MVRDVGPTYGSEINRVEFLELVQAVGGHVPASLQIVLGRPVEGGKFEFETTHGLCEDVEHLDCGICNVDADAVAGDAGDAVDLADFTDVGWHFGVGVYATCDCIGMLDFYEGWLVKWSGNN
jgi:hypothetical protein